MANLFLIVCILAVLTLAKTEEVKFKDCAGEGGKGKISQVNIIPCPSQPCALKKETTVEVEMFFSPSENVTDAKSVVHGIVGGIPVPFPLPNPDPCTSKGSGLTCPLKAGEKYVYKTALVIKSSYPDLKLVVKWELQDSKKQDIFCFEVPAQIVG